MPGDAVTVALLFLAANVRRRRLELTLTQEQFAERAEIDLRFFRFVEQGVKDVAVSSLVRLAEALKCSPADLLQPTEPMERKPGRPKKSESPARSAKRASRKKR